MAAHYLLNTNILLAYIRAGSIYAAVESKYTLWTATPAPIISIVTEGEIRVLAEEFSWGAAKRQLMEDLLTRFTAIPLPFADAIDRYVEVSEFSRKAGRALGKNDLWIAATAIATGATLLTTDRDFDHLHPALLTRAWVDPAAP